MSDIVILVVEDDVLIAMELEAALHEGGYATHCEVSGETAIAKLEATPEIRALLTDINLLGKIDGWAVAKRARELNSDLPVVYVTSLSADDWGSRGVPKSILVSKPFAAAQIRTAVSQLLNAPGSGQLPPG